MVPDGGADVGRVDSASELSPSKPRLPNVPGLDCSLLDGAYGQTPCDAITDQYLLALEYCIPPFPPRIPDGYFNEPFVPPTADIYQSTYWAEPCSPGLSETVNRATSAGRAAAASTGGAFELLSSRESPYYFEAVYRVTNFAANGEPGVTTLRNTRCDYFDGTTLGGAPHSSPDELAFLAGYLWFTVDRYSGDHLLGGERSRDGEVNHVDLCHTSFVHGDFGLCDQVGLHRTRYTEGNDGVVTIQPRETLRTVKGECHPYP